MTEVTGKRCCHGGRQRHGPCDRRVTGGRRRTRGCLRAACAAARRDRRTLRKGAGRACARVPTDVRDPDAVQALASTGVVAELGRPSCSSTAPLGNFICPAIDLSPNGWRAVVDIVLNGHVLHVAGGRACGLREAGRGGSILKHRRDYAWTGNPGTCTPRGEARASHLTRTLAVEWAPLEIRSTALAPGPVDTEAASAQLFPTEEIAPAWPPRFRRPARDARPTWCGPRASCCRRAASYITADA